MGASAGGVEALKILLGSLPAHPRAAFVVIVHSSPRSRSNLDKVLQNFTTMPVKEVQEDLPLSSGVVHTMPSDRDMVVEAGVLKLVARKSGAIHLPFDRFLASLAKDQGAGAVCVVLTGTGADGTIGLKSISEAGGLVLVQDPVQASYSGMPGNATSTGLVDAVLPLKEIGPYLGKILSSPHIRISERSLRHTPDYEHQVRRILGLLHDHGGHDLTGYKRSTVDRRILKRLMLSDAASLSSYVDSLERSPGERTALSKDLLIGVTSFFRDEEAFEALREHALPAIFRDRTDDETVRIWVACCSTGEEAYSVAMLVDEYLSLLGRRCPVTIFASDIRPEALATARRGVYPIRIKEDLSPDRIKAFFTCDSNGCTVSSSLREQIVFTRHDLLSDPPFMRMDLVFCRNFLIYLDHELQKTVVSTLAYALNPDGYLLLGPSETLGGFDRLFDPVDKKWRLYKRRQPAGVEGKPHLKASRRTDLGTGPAGAPGRNREPAPGVAAEKALLKRFAPPAALLDTNLDVVHLMGDIYPFLKLPAGEQSNNIFRLARKALRPHLRSSIQAARSSGMRSKAARVSPGGRNARLVDLVVDPMRDDAGTLTFLLVTFEDVGPPQTNEDVLLVGTPTEGGLIARYENELMLAQEQLQHAVEGYESLNEELKSSNEELISMNEELQASNEEMDASREELQALNEELQAKVGELAEANGFVENLLRSTNLATLFLDRDRRVMRFTPATQALFHLIPADQGRPIEQVKSTLEDEHFASDASLAMRDARTVEREVRSEDGAWYLKRVHPYQAPGGDVAGVVMTFAEVTQLKEAEQVLRRGKEELEGLVEERTREIRSWAAFPEENPNLVMRVGRDMVITHANKSSAPFLAANRTEVGRPFPEQYAGHIARAVNTEEGQSFEVVVGDSILALRAVLIADKEYVNVYGMDVTERRLLETARARDLTEIRRQRDFLESLINTAPIVVGVVEGPEHRYVQTNPAYEAVVPEASRPLVGRTLREAFPEVAQEVGELFDSIHRTGRPVHLREYEVPIEGRSTWWNADYVPVPGDDGDMPRILIVGHEITELVAARKQAEEEALKWRAVLDNLVEGLVLVKADGNILAVNPAGVRFNGFTDEKQIPGDFRQFQDLFELRDLDGRLVPAERRPITRALGGETFSGCELTVLRKDTGRSWVARFNGAPVKDRDGRFLFSFVCFEDVTERRRVSRELEKAHLFIGNIINAMPSKVICVDQAGLVTHFNTSAAAWLALPPDEALGVPLERAFPPLAARRHDIEGAYRERRSMLLENLAHQENGELHYLDVLIYPLDAVGLSGAVLRVDDVTDRVRISELMVQTEKMMSVGGLAAGMAHEINNPLAGILQSVQIIQMHVQPEREANRTAAEECGCTVAAIRCYFEKRQTMAMLEGIRESGLRAARIVSNMLEFSRKSASSRKPADLAEIMENSLELASRDYDLNKKYDFRRMAVVRDYDPNLGPVPCVRNEIEQVVFNLVTNAAQAMANAPHPGDAPSIVIRTRRLPGRARIEVQDNGPGMEESVRRRVFEPFFTTKEPGTGTGLGLSVSYFIVTTKHNGSIRVESSPGKGSTFIVELPLGADK